MFVACRVYGSGSGESLHNLRGMRLVDAVGSDVAYALHGKSPGQIAVQLGDVSMRIDVLAGQQFGVPLRPSTFSLVVDRRQHLTWLGARIEQRGGRNQPNQQIHRPTISQT